MFPNLCTYESFCCISSFCVFLCLGNSLLVTSAKNENSEYEVVLFDSKREKVFQLSTKEYTIKIPVKSLPTGLYYLNIVSKEATIQRQILIERK
ncbi:MAG: T9SS type A sorting domain-containing protein [Bacteroidota bacterium]